MPDTNLDNLITHLSTYQRQRELHGLHRLRLRRL